MRVQNSLKRKPPRWTLPAQGSPEMVRQRIGVALAASLPFLEIAYRVAVARRARGRRRRALGLANVSGVAELLVALPHPAGSP